MSGPWAHASCVLLYDVSWMYKYVQHRSQVQVNMYNYVHRIDEAWRIYTKVTSSFVHKDKGAEHNTRGQDVHPECI